MHPRSFCTSLNPAHPLIIPNPFPATTARRESSSPPAPTPGSHPLWSLSNRGTSVRWAAPDARAIPPRDSRTHSFVDGGAKAVQMLPHGVDALVELLAEIADLFRVFVNLLLPPTVIHGEQKGDQRAGCCDHHPVGHTIFNQDRVALYRCAEEGIAGQKQHGELRCFRQAVPIGL